MASRSNKKCTSSKSIAANGLPRSPRALRLLRLGSLSAAPLSARASRGCPPKFWNLRCTAASPPQTVRDDAKRCCRAAALCAHAALCPRADAFAAGRVATVRARAAARQRPDAGADGLSERRPNERAVGGANVRAELSPFIGAVVGAVVGADGRAQRRPNDCAVGRANGRAELPHAAAYGSMSERVVDEPRDHERRDLRVRRGAATELRGAFKTNAQRGPRVSLNAVPAQVRRLRGRRGRRFGRRRAFRVGEG